MARPDYQASAEFSECGEHRLRLDRWWSDAPRALVCGCNPSMAGVEKNDATIYRLFDLLSWRPSVGGFTMMNAETYIATDPADMNRWRGGLDLDALRACRAANLDCIRGLSAAAPVRIAAFGGLLPPGPHKQRLLAALSLDGEHPIHAFGLTNAGDPKHPLARGHHRIPNNVSLIVWLEAGRIAA